MVDNYRGYSIRSAKLEPGKIMYYCDSLKVESPTRVGIEREIDQVLRDRRIKEIASGTREI